MTRQKFRGITRVAQGPITKNYKGPASLPPLRRRQPQCIHCTKAGIICEEKATGNGRVCIRCSNQRSTVAYCNMAAGDPALAAQVVAVIDAYEAAAADPARAAELSDLIDQVQSARDALFRNLDAPAPPTQPAQPASNDSDPNDSDSVASASASSPSASSEADPSEADPSEANPSEVDPSEADHEANVTLYDEITTRLASLEETVQACVNAAEQRLENSAAARERRMIARLDIGLAATEERLVARLNTSDQHVAETIKAEFEKLRNELRSGAVVRE